MRLITFSRGGHASEPGVLRDGEVIGLSGLGIPDLLSLIRGGTQSLARARAWAAEAPAGAVVPLKSVHYTVGNYDVVITADNHATAVISGVPVPNDTTVTSISASSTPFLLANSSTQAIAGKVTLSPADDDGTVIVAAKQSLSGGPTVTVKSVVATVLDDPPPALPIGDYGYNVTLPTAAPWLGQYSTTLPIALSATVPDQSTVAKIYTIRGSAQVGTTVYATQNPAPSAKDITIVANQTQDFTLSTP